MGVPFWGTKGSARRVLGRAAGSGARTLTFTVVNVNDAGGWAGGAAGG
jgi:hypothetical protein